jgi:hypothetical protein
MQTSAKAPGRARVRVWLSSRDQASVRASIYAQAMALAQAWVVASVAVVTMADERAACLAMSRAACQATGQAVSQVVSQVVAPASCKALRRAGSCVSTQAAGHADAAGVTGAQAGICDASGPHVVACTGWNACSAGAGVEWRIACIGVVGDGRTYAASTATAHVISQVCCTV